VVWTFLQVYPAFSSVSAKQTTNSVFGFTCFIQLKKNAQMSSQNPVDFYTNQGIILSALNCENLNQNPSPNPSHHSGLFTFLFSCPAAVLP
jgi:hypothetical protein